MDKLPAQFVLVDILAYVGGGAMAIIVLASIVTGSVEAPVTAVMASPGTVAAFLLISYFVGFFVVAVADLLDAVISDGESDEYRWIFKQIHHVVSFQWLRYEKSWDDHARCHELAFQAALEQSHPVIAQECGDAGVEEVKSVFASSCDSYAKVERLRTLERLGQSLASTFSVAGLVLLLAAVLQLPSSGVWFVGFALLFVAIVFTHQCGRLSRLSRIQEAACGLALLKFGSKDIAVQ